MTFNYYNETLTFKPNPDSLKPNNHPMDNKIELNPSTPQVKYIDNKQGAPKVLGENIKVSKFNV